MEKQFVKLCEVGDLKGVEKALLSGTCVNSRPRYGLETGLIAALKQKHTAVVRLLLEQDGIDISDTLTSPSSASPPPPSSPTQGGRQSFYNHSNHYHMEPCISVISMSLSK